MQNSNQNQNTQAVVPYYHRNSCTSQLPVLDPVSDTEGFDKIIGIHQMDSHWYILASTRSGKSEFIKLIYIRLALKAEGSIVLIDPHGDLARQCAKLHNDKKDIIYIDPTSKKGVTPTINPFRLKKRDEATIAIVAQELIVALESIIGADFTQNMEVLLTPLIYTLLRKGDSGVDELSRFLDDNANEDLIAEALKSPIKAHVDFIQSQFKKGKFTKTKDALSTKLQTLLNNPTFSNFITGDSTLNLEKAINNKKIIIFRLPKGKMRKVLEPAAKLIMALIQSIVFKRSDLPEHLRPKTHLICDEYQNFFSQMSDEILSESAKNNLFILGAHQYLSQLDTKSKDGLMSGANIKIVGKNSNKDLKAMAEEIEVDIQFLKSLKQGEFYIKVGSNPALKITTTDKFLGNSGSIKIYLLSKFDFSLEHLKDKLIFMKSEALEQLDSIDDSLSIWNDEKLSKKEINFNFTAKKIVRLYEEQMVKIDNFSNVNNFFSQLLFSIQELKNTDEKFKTTDREKLKQVLEDGYLGAYSDLLYSEWSKETDKINKFYIVCIKAYFVGKISQDMLLGIFTILQSIKQNLEEFYIVIRSGIVVKYKENPKSELLQHISVKDRVFKIYKNSQPKFIELLKKETSQVAYRFLNSLLSELLDFKFEEKSEGYEEIYERMVQLHSTNLEIYLNDIEMYGKELEKRDLEISKLIFKMQTDLEK